MCLSDKIAEMRNLGPPPKAVVFNVADVLKQASDDNINYVLYKRGRRRKIDSINIPV